jgi:ParB family chromosome partitioning protein
MTTKPASTPTPAQPEMREILIGNIDHEGQQIRVTTQTEDIEELAMDIQRHGLMQPIGVQMTPTGRYQLLWGRRRLEAHKYLKRKGILARVYDAGDQTVKSVAIRENVHRLAMTLQEECDAVAHLADTEGRSPDDIGAMLGKGRAWVMRRLAIPNLPPEVIDELLAGHITLGAAESISRIPNEPDRAWIIGAHKQARWTQAQLDQAVNQALQLPDVSEAVEAGYQAAQSSVAQQPLMMACAACGAAKPMADLMLIRVCNGGCDEHTAD